MNIVNLSTIFILSTSSVTMHGHKNKLITARNPKIRQNQLKAIFLATFIKASIVASPKIKENEIATREYVLKFILPSKPSPTSATKTAGMLIRKLSFNALFASYFLKRRAEMVSPDRLNPGRTANP